MAVRPLQWLLHTVLDESRLIYGIAMIFDLPAEDEIATSGLSGEGACSSHHCILHYRTKSDRCPVDLGLAVSPSYKQTCSYDFLCHLSIPLLLTMHIYQSG